MFRLNKTTIVCAMLASFAVFGGDASAQRRAAAAPQAESPEAMPSLGEVGIVLDFANRQPEFRDAVKPMNTDRIRALLLEYGMSRSVQVYDGPMNNIVPGGPYTNCFTSATTVYYPQPTYYWPDHGRTIILIICDNSGGGTTGFGWD